MTVKEFLADLQTLAPFSSALSWDHVGLLVGNENMEIQGVHVALDATDAVIERALAKQANLLLTHHPLLFSPLERVCAQDLIGRRVLKMAEEKMSYIAMHTNFDVHVMGNLVADRLQLQNRVVLDVTEESLMENVGIGVVSDILPTSLEAYAQTVKDAFGLPYVNYFGAKDATIHRLAICPGSGKSEIHAALVSGADCLLTGDIDHHSGIDAVAQGLCILDAGHYGLEHLFIDYMANWLQTKCPSIPISKEERRFPIHSV